MLAVEVSEQFTLSYETPEQTLEADIAPGTKTVKAFLWDKSLLPLDMTVYQMPADPSSSLRVLAIGNSFSEDSMRWLYQIAADYGIEEIILGHLYIGGCSLEQHWGFANSGATEYTYYKNTDGAWQNTGSKSMEYGLTDEYWDIITLQQASGKSGMKDTYEPYLGNLVTYIDEHKLNPDAKLLWHMTWAYQSGSGNAEFVNYDNDQATMYHAICNAVQEVVLPGDRFDGVIPTGTAIQNVRTSYIGDTLTRDGSHLNEYRGRYIAGLMWFKALTGYDIDGITYVPNASEIDARALAVIKEAVNAAYATPYTVTPSSDAN